MGHPQDKVQGRVSAEVSGCPDLCQRTGFSIGQAGLWKRGMKAKLCCLSASGAGLSHPAADPLNAGTGPVEISSRSLSLGAVLGLQGREAGWDP